MCGCDLRLRTNLCITLWTTKQPVDKGETFREEEKIKKSLTVSDAFLSGLDEWLLHFYRHQVSVWEEEI